MYIPIGFILRFIIHAFKLANTILNYLINFSFNNMAPVIAGVYNVFFRYSNINRKKGAALLNDNGYFRK